MPDRDPHIGVVGHVGLQVPVGPQRLVVFAQAVDSVGIQAPPQAVPWIDLQQLARMHQCRQITAPLHENSGELAAGVVIFRRLLQDFLEEQLRIVQNVTLDPNLRQQAQGVEMRPVPVKVVAHLCLSLIDPAFVEEAGGLKKRRREAPQFRYTGAGMLRLGLLACDTK